MKLGPHSQRRMQDTFEIWRVPQEFSEPMRGYLIHGWSPGSFFEAVLANDALGAFARSHPSNTMTALKALAGWINDYMPPVAWGSYERVQAWLQLTTEERRTILDQTRLIYTDKQEMWMILQESTAPTP